MKNNRLYRTFLFLIVSILCGTVSAQKVIKAEYFFDNDPGPGKGISITLPAADSIDHSFQINAVNLSKGFHTLFIRTANQTGKWSIAEGRIFFVDTGVVSIPAILNQSEYFIDNDPGPGKGIPFSNHTGIIDSIEKSITVSNLTPGFHNFFTRTKNSKGAWSMAEGRVFWVDTPEFIPADSLIGMEYYLDEDPGTGKGIALPLTGKPNTDSLIELKAPNLPFGSYNICFRVKNSKNAWGIAECRTFRVCETYGPLAGFTLVQSGNKISLLNRSEHALSYRWNLNETDRGETENLFLELEGGYYDVSLAAKNGCGDDTLRQLFTIEGLTGVVPASAGNTGKSTIHIQGFGFMEGTTFKLVKDGIEIPADAARVERENSLVASLYPKNMPLGFYRLEVQIPGKPLLVKDSAFEVSETVQPRIMVSTRIPERIRWNAKNLFKVFVTNTGNVDAYGIPVLIGGFPISSEIKLLNDTSATGPGIEYETNPKAAFQRFLVTDTAEGTKMIPVFIPQLTAGETFEILIEFKGKENNTTFNYFVNALEPLYINYIQAIDWSGEAGTTEATLGDDCGGGGGGGVGPPKPCLDCVEKQAAESAAEIGRQLLDQFLNDSKIGQLIFGKQISCVKGIGEFTRDVYKKMTEKEKCPGGGTGSNTGAGKKVMSFADWALGAAKLTADCYLAFNPAAQLALKTRLAIDLLGVWDEGKKIYNIIDIQQRGIECATEAKKPCEPPACPECKGGGSTAVLSSWDPNEKAGPGYANNSFIQTNTNGSYTVSYENAPTAGLSAQTVYVSDSLDILKINPASLLFKTASIGNKTIALTQDGYAAIGEIDLRPEVPFIARINAIVDTATGIIQWQVQTIDTATGQETTDPLAGFLPPNDSSHRGEGNFTFEVALRENLSVTDTLRNKAIIVFDGNPPIVTNYWTNFFDNQPPSSNMLDLPDTLYTDTLALRWAGTDNRSGIRYYDIYVSINDSAYTLLLSQTTATADTLTGVFNQHYAFYSIATDMAGNRETPKSAPETTTFTVLKPTTFIFTGSGKYSDAANWVNSIVPPEILPGGSEIIINHTMGGECILNKMQRIANGGKFTIAPGKKITFVSDVEIEEK